MGRTGHRGERDADEGEETGKKRIDLSVSQVAGAGVATLAAATAASYLNVYGTVVGAAVMATLSTLASPFLQDLFSRGGDQARQFAGKTAGHAGPAGTGSHRTGTHPLDPPGTGPVPGLPPTGPIPGLPGEADTTRTMALPVLDGGGPAAHTPGAGAATRPPAAPDGPRAPGRAPGRTPERKAARRGWRACAVTAAVVFGLVMLVILLFEVFTGRSLTAWTQGQEEHTSPTLFGGTSAPPAQEDGGAADLPQERGPEDGTGQGTQDPVDEPAGPEAPDTGAEQPAEDGGRTDPVTPGGGDTAEPGDGQADPGTGDGGSDSGGADGAEGSAGTGGTGAGTGNTLPEAPAG